MWDKTVDIDNNEGIRVNLITLIKGMLVQLRRNAAKLVILAVLSGAVFFAGAKLAYSPVYTARASFTFNRVTGASYKTGTEKNSIIVKLSLMFTEIMTGDALRSIVMDELGYAGSKSFNVKINAAGQEAINIVSLSVTADDPQLAYDTLQSLMRNVSKVTGPAFGEIEVKVLSDEGLPTSPSGRISNKLAAAAGILLALMIELIWLVLKSLSDHSIKNRKDMPRLLKIELLGVLPKAKRAGFIGAKSPVIIDAEGVSTEMVGAVHTILSRIEREAQENKMKSILITSALAGEGKTSTAVNLAIALAGQEKKVALVEGNLRNPSILSILGMPQMEKGLSDLLSGGCKAQDVMIPYTKHNNLTLLPGGKLSANPATLWSSPAAVKLFKELEADFDYVLIDSPASASISDSGLLARLADGYVYVVRKGYAQLPILRKGMGTLSNFGCKAIGSVLNAD